MNDRMAGSKPGSNNLLVDCGKPHCELLDLELGVVWQSHGPITQEAYDALELPAKWIKVGIGVGVMDEHFFRRSPGANEDGPLAEREVDVGQGRRREHASRGLTTSGAAMVLVEAAAASPRIASATSC